MRTFAWFTGILLLGFFAGFAALYNPVKKPERKISPPAESFNITSEGLYRSDNSTPVVSIDDLSADSIVSISNYELAPNQHQICFTAWTPAVPILYLVDTDGSDIKKIDWGQDCVWSKDSAHIAYRNKPTDISPIDIYVFDVASLQSKNMTSHLVKSPLIRYYEIPTWSDNNFLIAGYTQSDILNGTESKGILTINLVSEQ